MQKLEIQYPADWEYKIIGQAKDMMLKDVKNILGEKKYHVQDSRVSSSGKYSSLNINVKVDSETERNAIFKSLNASENIKIVI